MTEEYHVPCSNSAFGLGFLKMFVTAGQYNWLSAVSAQNVKCYFVMLNILSELSL